MIELTISSNFYYPRKQTCFSTIMYLHFRYNWDCKALQLDFLKNQNIYVSEAYIFCAYVNIFLKIHTYVFNILRNELELMSNFLWINIQFTRGIHCCDIWIFTEIRLVIFYRFFKITGCFVCMYTQQKGHLIQWSYNYRWLWATMWLLGIELGPLKEQPVLFNH